MWKNWFTFIDSSSPANLNIILMVMMIIALLVSSCVMINLKFVEKIMILMQIILDFGMYVYSIVP